MPACNVPVYSVPAAPPKLDWTKLDLDWTGPDRLDLDWTGLDRTGLDLGWVWGRL